MITRVNTRGVLTLLTVQEANRIMSAGGVIEVYNNDTKVVDFVAYADYLGSERFLGSEFYNKNSKRLKTYKDIIDEYVITKDLFEFRSRMQIECRYVDQLRGWWDYFANPDSVTTLKRDEHSYNIINPYNEVKDTKGTAKDCLIINP